jgi:hypothetical protein
MRADMAKVIVERPRYGSRLRGARKGYRKRFCQIALEDQPKHERIEERGGGMKHFNEHLGPLRRYLQGQVGRPWNKVFSEICAHISRDSVVQDHVRDHVWDYVVAEVKLNDGVPCYAAGRLCDQPLNRNCWSRVPLLYVCPRSGLLRRVKPVGRRRDRGRPPNPRDGGRLTLIPFDADCAFALVNGQWQYIEFAPFPVRAYRREANGFYPVPQAADAIFDLIVRQDAVRFYGRAAYAARTRPATRGEIRRFCTKGGVPDLV